MQFCASKVAATGVTCEFQSIRVQDLSHTDRISRDMTKQGRCSKGLDVSSFLWSRSLHSLNGAWFHAHVEETGEPDRHSWTKCPPSAVSFAKSPRRMRTGKGGRLDSAVLVLRVHEWIHVGPTVYQTVQNP